MWLILGALTIGVPHLEEPATLSTGQQAAGTAPRACKLPRAEVVKLWLPPHSLPPGGGLVHVLELAFAYEDGLACLDMLESDASSSTPDDQVDACAGRPRDERDALLDEKALRLAMVSSVRPERNSLFWHMPEAFCADDTQLVAVLLKDNSTVFGGWPHDSWTRHAPSDLCLSKEEPLEYARRRLDYFVEHCHEEDDGMDEAWAGHSSGGWRPPLWENICWRATREEVEADQFAYLDMLRLNGTDCYPGRLYNQLMVQREPGDVVSIFHTPAALDVARRYQAALNERPRGSLGPVELVPFLEGPFSSCCDEPDCESPL